MDTRMIYFAGSLFSHKDLIGNYLLARAIDHESHGDLRCILPQNLEQTVSRAVDVRNQDLLKVIECDLALFNFDGTDLDSGTIVEFMMAKMLDVPAVVFRTDFRWSGDQNKDGDPWNLMCSGYPRTTVILKNGMADYQAAEKISKTESELFDNFYKPLAHEIVEAFSTLRTVPSLFEHNVELARSIYHWAVKSPGGGLTVPADWCDKIVARKAKLGLI